MSGAIFRDRVNIYLLYFEVFKYLTYAFLDLFKRNNGCLMSLKVKADVIENRLYFKFSGDVAKEELDRAYTDVKFLVADLSPGFDVIDDYSDCDIEQINSRSLKKITNYLVTNGLGEVVRIVNGDSLLHEHAEILSSATSKIIPVYARSHEEAKEQLKQSAKRNGIRFNINNLPITYSNNNICGTGNLVNISTGGFSAESIMSRISIGDEIYIQIIRNKADFSEEKFAAKARVIRADDNSFAAKFDGLNSNQKNQLWKCLITAPFGE